MMFVQWTMYKQFSTETLLLRNCLKIFMRKGHPWGMNHTLHKLSSGPLHGQLCARKHHFKEQIRKKVQQRRKVFSPPVSDLGAGAIRKWRQAECHAKRSHFLPCSPHPVMSREPTYSSTSKSLPVLHKPVSPGEWTVSIAGCQLPFTHLHLSLNDSVQQPHRECTGRETGSEEEGSFCLQAAYHWVAKELLGRLHRAEDTSLVGWNDHPVRWLSEGFHNALPIRHSASLWVCNLNNWRSVGSVLTPGRNSCSWVLGEWSSVSACYEAQI